MSAWRRIGREGGERLMAVDARAAAMSFDEVLAGWRDDRAFRADTVAALAASDMRAFFWELPPLDPRTAALAFECSLVPGDALLRTRADPSTFAARFVEGSPGPVARFSNLGGDATLLSPRPISPTADYGHAAAFFRTAPAEQSEGLLSALATLATRPMAERPVWISTAGLGVPWLHVRFDARPKYYRTRRYADAAWTPEPPRRG